VPGDFPSAARRIAAHTFLARIGRVIPRACEGFPYKPYFGVGAILLLGRTAFLNATLRRRTLLLLVYFPVYRTAAWYVWNAYLPWSFAATECWWTPQAAKAFYRQGI
jgi:hypothetical protein